ncbi:bifunctional adenosylcobinamide kinase/adenosylcobinamide-phosphate guanylyltransferase [Psychromonas antarctica]|uniref:bifunctional adenosylcobinamide kinase/adenosylcobinamide-phosphate guanylyltransferase n=1 Tax=Psychromonas antarctica TaxID=67573 RepID=UPI001EE7A32F|nr:bifunctional adenosylcobinamide kinase/adenosylcobinamide-phosphate guanylyltransferase [Psychromonas antarctica]MCG6202480.1 bifunctional adenosylcobinamide kinase/adenosylcobinamide-phosphate guanylyltransferase [Psychromonas antarctica]
MIHLILGGARSGKSAFAEQTVLNQCEKPVYIATATAIDSEMQSRITHHQQLRGNKWTLYECPLGLTDLLATELKNSTAQPHYLVDCLTLWLNNLIFTYDSQLQASHYQPTSEEYEQISSAIDQALTLFLAQLARFKYLHTNIT